MYMHCVDFNAMITGQLFYQRDCFIIIDHKIPKIKAVKGHEKTLMISGLIREIDKGLKVMVYYYVISSSS